MGSDGSKSKFFDPGWSAIYGLGLGFENFP